MLEYFEESKNQNKIKPAIYEEFRDLFKKWRETKGLQKTENLRELQQFYKTII